jgi:hypothetical protein
MNGLIVEYAVAVADILHDPLELSGLEKSLHMLCIESESLTLWFKGVQITNITYTDVNHQFWHAKYQVEETIETHMTIHH